MTGKDRLTEIESALTRFMPKEAGLAEPVRSAMEYALMAGGKRIRPQLLMMTYDAFCRKAEENADGRSGKDSGDYVANRDIPLAFASALEMIHTYSLIHDDLPAMDDDSLRRGRPTVHVAFGEDIAILAGDGLLNIAYEVASDCFDTAPGDCRVERAMRILARKPGLFGMLGGQTADVTLAGKPISDEQLEYIYANKTAALLECAMQIGAVLGGASEEEAEVVRRAAYDAGIAFQVQDDILDMTGTAEELGKEVGQDERNEKTTYVTLRGMDAAKAYVQEKTDAATRALGALFSVNWEEAGGEETSDTPVDMEEGNAPAKELIRLLQSLAGRRA